MAEFVRFTIVDWFSREIFSLVARGQSIDLVPYSITRYSFESNEQRIQPDITPKSERIASLPEVLILLLSQLRGTNIHTHIATYRLVLKGFFSGLLILSMA